MIRLFIFWIFDFTPFWPFRRTHCINKGTRRDARPCPKKLTRIAKKRNTKGGCGPGGIGLITGISQLPDKGYPRSDIKSLQLRSIPRVDRTVEIKCRIVEKPQGLTKQRQTKKEGEPFHHNRILNLALWVVNLHLKNRPLLCQLNPCCLYESLLNGGFLRTAWTSGTTE